MANDNDLPTCGKGLAANSWLPSTLSDLTAALADVLEHHTSALDKNEEAGRQEYDAYENLVKSFRDVSVKLSAFAKEMSGYRDLPMAEHDMSVMNSRRSLEVFENFVQRKQDLRNLLQKTAIEDEEMLAQLRG
jgi:hypothetical protein